jgi:carbon storage regulator CsrA
MLVLRRRLGEQICIGNSILVTLVSVHAPRVRLGIEAPLEVPVEREELRRRRAETAPHDTGRVNFVSPTGAKREGAEK